MRLTGKVALVTGAAQGIGAAIARRFLDEGASVFLADVQADCAMDVPEGARAWFVRLDVTRESEWVAAFAEVRARAGRLDVLVNNAGVNIREPIERMTAANLDTMLAVNLKGPFLGIKHVLPLMRESGGGSIINMSSICGLVGHRFTPEAYTMVKGGLTLLTRSVGVRYAKENIRCNSVHPSTVETALVREVLKDPERRAERMGEVPLGRLATVDDVAAACVYLASDEAAFLNGISLPVDGGLTAG
ncbi:MAG: glucose 1-dehydrogenase [Spirochaetes bacterium]|nr:glucose 1-dehydrogenase [Spirochaetota bacterium]